MGGLDPAISTAENYRVWASEAHGLSPAYESLAGAVADDDAIVRFLASLPPPKRQPNLLFAAARYLLGEPPVIGELRRLVRQDAATLSRVMLARRTQTNEPPAAPRCCPRWPSCRGRWR